LLNAITGAKRYKHMFDANQYYRPKAEASLGNAITRNIAGFIMRVVSRSGASSHLVVGLLLLFDKYLIAFGWIVDARRD